MAADDSRSDEPLEPTAPRIPSTEAMWEAILLGTDRGMQHVRRVWKHVPSSPRCKLCAAPFHGAGRILTSIAMHGPSNTNPLLCSTCFSQLGKTPGGAEIPISVLFADVRGSTGIAERTSPAEFRRLLQRYYRIAAEAVERNGGIVDKFLGDGVMALFIPVFSGENHPARAIQAALSLLAEVGKSDLATAGVGIGAGVQTGIAYVGALGSGERLDFSALGDVVNVAARLGSVAAAGELLVGSDAWAAGGREAVGAEADGFESREVSVAGRSAPLEIVVLRTGRGAEAAASRR